MHVDNVKDAEGTNMNIDKTTFFKYEISEILDPENRADQPGDLRERVESFVRDCAGTADGEMDISFQENGRGYYAHLHELERLKKKNKNVYREYLYKLHEELEEAERNGEMTHQMKTVLESLK
jgi:ribosomal protein S6